MLLLALLERCLDHRHPLRGPVLGGRGARVDHADGLAQATGKHREVRLDLLRLELLSSEVQRAVAVVNPDLEVVVPDGVDDDCLNLGEGGEGDHGGEARDLEGGVNLAELLEEAQDSDLKM